MSGCQRRVSDNGDMDYCGKPVVADGFCRQCRLEALSSFTQKVIKLRAELASVLEKIDRLDNDDVLDSLMLRDGFSRWFPANLKPKETDL